MPEIVYQVTYLLHEEAPFPPGTDRATAYEAVTRRCREILSDIEAEDGAHDINVNVEDDQLPGEPVAWNKPMDGKDSPWASDGFAIVRRGCGVSAVQSWRREGLVQGVLGMAPETLIDGAELDTDSDPYVRVSYSQLLGAGEHVKVWRPRSTWGSTRLRFVVVYRNGEIVVLLAASTEESEPVVGMKRLSELGVLL